MVGFRAPPLPPAGAKAAETEWVPLPEHPVFANHGASGAVASGRKSSSSGRTKKGGNTGPSNLAAWDAAGSRLYLWDSDGSCVHRISLRFGDPNEEGASSIEAASPSEILLTDTLIDLSIHHVALNGEGSALLLAGTDGLFIVYIYDRVSSCDDSLICRTVSVGSETYFKQKNGLRIMQVSWHPYSSTHVGILSSDSVFRLFDLSSDLERPEQEFYLQPMGSDKCGSAMSICPVAFSFGREHLWDRLSVFILYSDGSLYILCPVVPFGSVWSWASIQEIYEDANLSRLKLSNAKAVSNLWFAATWLEATFPELASRSVIQDNVSGLRAHPYCPMDASLSLQGPLFKFSHGMEDGNPALHADNKGKATGLLYNSIGKDSVLVVTWSNGQLSIDALADEVQPLWNVGISPRLRVDSHGRTLGTAMICEPITHEPPSTEKLNLTFHQGNSETMWFGNPPPLLRLATVDLALPKAALDCSIASTYADTIVPERIYCLHAEGVDLIILHFLPFSNINSGADEMAKAPSVFPLLSSSDSEASTESLLHGFVTVADSVGQSHIVGVTSCRTCVVLETKQWNELPPVPLDLIVNSDSSSLADHHITEIISKELLSGPKTVIIPESTALRALVADSIEGRSALHHYIKLFHEHYVEYAHKVYFELKQHGNHLRTILNEQHERLHHANQMISTFESKQLTFKDRIHRAIKGYTLLEHRLKSLKALPGTKKKPLSRAEREFKTELERMGELELDVLHTSVEALNARLRRYIQSSPGCGALATSRQIKTKRNQVTDVHISQLKLSMEKLSFVNGENTKKVRVIQHALKSQEND